MKTQPNLFGLTRFTLMALLLIFFTGCDALNNDEPEVGALSEADIEAASSIIAESISDQNEGLMANLNDMTAGVEVNRLNYSERRFGRTPGLRPCRGANREFEKTYDETTGVHAINYSRQHEGEGCQKNVEVSLNYIFTDTLGGFIAEPRVNQDQVAAIAFEGTRVGSGSSEKPRGSRSVTFNQAGNWNLQGLQSDVATLEGTQTNSGSFEYTRPDSTGESMEVRSGNYHLEFSTVDVAISQTAGEETDLETQISGTIQYKMTMEKNMNGETETQEMEGTIELEGNGRALLRFLGLKKIYRVTLDNGDIRDTNDLG